MHPAALDLDTRVPSAGPVSSRAYRYSLRAHLAAMGAGDGSRAPTTATPRTCARTEYLLGLALRLELRRRGLLGWTGRRRAAGSPV